MRTLLTGASGYVGLHVVRALLEDGQDVTALVRSPDRLGPFARDPRVTVFEADLEDDARVAAAFPGHDVCVHAALIWGDPASEPEARDVAVTARVFDAAGRAGLKRAIYVSSTAVHRPFAGEMSEDDPLHPTEIYGATKAAGEHGLRAACARHGMTGIVVRPGPVVGPPAFPGGSFRTPDRISEMVRAAMAGHPIEVASGEGRQFSEVAIVARALRILTQKDGPHPTYVCVDRDDLSWERVAQVVIASANSPSRLSILPRDASEPVPRFRTQRIDSLLGGPSNAEGALREHVGHLVRTAARGKSSGRPDKRVDRGR
jgi:UDP-glucose 4-epimerase